MKYRNTTSQRAQGTAAIEFVVVLPLIVTLLIGMWEGGRLIEVEQIINNAAREGARQAATAQVTDAEVKQIVLNYLASAGIPTTNAVVTVDNLGWTGNPAAPDDNPKNSTQLDEFKITIAVPFRDVQWIAIHLVTDSNTQMNGEAVWCSLKDIAFPSVDYPAPD